MNATMDLELIPVMPPPPGQISDFNSPMSEVQRKFLSIYAGTLAAATFTLVLRIWTRGWIVKSFWLDDFAVIASWLMDIGFLVSCILWMKEGFGQHIWNVSVAMLQRYVELVTAVVTVYCWAPMLSKFSILLLYHRVNPSKPFRAIVYFIMFMIFAYTIATTVIVAAGCKPTDPEKVQCINNLALAQGILNIVSDALIVILPIPMIVKLHVSTSQKIAISFVMLGGSFVIVASIVRLYFIEQLPGKPDTTWAEAEVCIWSAIELNVGVMCNCLIALKPMLQKYCGALLSYAEGTSGTPPPNGNPLAAFRRSLRKSQAGGSSYTLGSLYAFGKSPSDADGSPIELGDKKGDGDEFGHREVQDICVTKTTTIDVEERRTLDDPYFNVKDCAGWMNYDPEDPESLTKHGGKNKL